VSTTDFLRSVGEKLCKVEQELFDVVQEEVARFKEARFEEEGQDAFEGSTAEEFDAEFVRRLRVDAEFQRQLKVIAQQYCDIELSVERFFRCSESELCWSAYSNTQLRHFGLWRAFLEVGEGSLLVDNLTSAFCDRCCLDSQ
jgi:hypothetical protein